MPMNVGDIVTRKSYNHDVNFIVEGISNDQVTLSGVHYRLHADALESDLDVIGTRGVSEQLQTSESRPVTKAEDTRGIKNSLFGWIKDEDSHELNHPSDHLPPLLIGKRFVRILHIDANEHYLNKSLSQYEKFDLPVTGFSIPEELQPDFILGLLQKYQPNILVLTGHDAVSKDRHAAQTINGYLNSKYFVEAIHTAREFNRNYDELVIIAGGCKSYYEALMEAGANFASSPNRVMISITEPVNIACKIAASSIRTVVSMDNIAKVISSGFEGFGGIETRGQCREIKPMF
ncbi:MAG: sporulation peptidase YabG [bacterium]|nr:sporulation peptidase YabG [bacterium]